MATALTIDKNHAAEPVDMELFGAGDRLFLRLSRKIDDDLPPTEDDFVVSFQGNTVAVRDLRAIVDDKGTLLTLWLNEALPAEGEVSLRYAPTQWFMCDQLSGDSLPEFELCAAPKAPDWHPLGGEHSKNAKSRIATLHRPANTFTWTVSSAQGFCLQLHVDASLDSIAPLDKECFRAEMDDRWLTVLTARFVRAHVHADPEIQLEFTEPLPPGAKIQLAYRSPKNNLRTIAGAPLPPFSLDVVVEPEPLRMRATDSLEQGESTIDASPLKADEPGRAPQDNVILKKVVVPQADSQAELMATANPSPNVEAPAPEAQGEHEEIHYPEAEVASSSLSVSIMPSKGVNEALYEAGAQSTDSPSTPGGGKANKIARVEKALQHSTARSRPQKHLSLSAKMIYLVPIIVLAWVLVVLGVYLASMFMDLNPQTPVVAGGNNPAQSILSKREPCRVAMDDGSLYVGECVNGERDGLGVFTWASGNRYEGEWLNGLRHGKGKLIYTSGAVYEGQFAAGTENGQGKMVWPNGASYEGNYLNGRFHGQGTYIASNKNSFTGEFMNGSMTNEGRCTMASGEQYAGPCRAQ